MAELPAKLQEIIEDFEFITDRRERSEYLIEIADRFEKVRVPESIASQPYDESHRVKACESQAYVWSEENENGTLNYWFDVLNPQGLSAMAMSVILNETLSGEPLEVVAEVKPEIVFTFFGKDVSMGKGQGLMGIVAMTQYDALKKLGRL